MRIYKIMPISSNFLKAIKFYQANGKPFVLLEVLKPCCWVLGSGVVNLLPDGKTWVLENSATGKDVWPSGLRDLL